MYDFTVCIVTYNTPKSDLEKIIKKEIENAIKRNDIKAEIHHHYLQYNILKYMKIRGGSEAYPIEKSDPIIEEEKQFIAKHIDKALF